MNWRRKWLETRGHLSWDGDALGEGQEDDDPTKQQAKRQLPSHAAHLVETTGYIQHVVTETNKIHTREYRFMRTPCDVLKNTIRYEVAFTCAQKHHEQTWWETLRVHLYVYVYLYDLSTDHVGPHYTINGEVATKTIVVCTKNRQQRITYWKKSSVGDTTASAAAESDDVTLTSLDDTGKQVSLNLR